MFKRAVSLILCGLYLTLFLHSCNFFVNDKDYESYKKLKIGEHFLGNRDGYAIKVNDTILIWHSLSENEDDDVKVINCEDTDVYGMDVLNGSDEIFSDNFEFFYSSNDYVILFLKDNKNVVLLDCKNNNKYKYFSDITDLQSSYKNIDYQSTDYTFVDLQMNDNG